MGYLVRVPRPAESLDQIIEVQEAVAVCSPTSPTDELSFPRSYLVSHKIERPANYRIAVHV